MFNYDPKVDGKETKDMFDKMYKHMKFDKKLATELHRFRVDWSRKGIEYSEFLGGNTIGLHTIRFSSRDDNLLMNEIYYVDVNDVKNNIVRIPAIDPKWAIATNPVLQTLAYTMHRFIVDGKLGNKLDIVLRDCYYIFAYKVLGSLLSHYFEHNTTPAIAKAAFEQLSNRFLIKRLGSWGAVLEHRALDIIPKNGLHYKRLLRYSADDSIRIVNDLQGRIRETIKNIYRVMLDVRDNKTGIRSTSMVESNNGNSESSKDIVDRPDKYVVRLNEILGAPASLIDRDLIYLINAYVKSSDMDIINATLLTLSEEHDPRNNKDVYAETIILKTIEYCNTKGVSSSYKENIDTIIPYMRGYWSSGSVKDVTVINVKKIIEGTVRRSTRKKTKWVIYANTLAVIIYLFVRSVK